jgi:mannose-6-phosphate isomerase-like protein (cupin superfamily)
MIVQDVASPVRPITAGPGPSRWQCLVRRGMIYSECESVDHILLEPSAFTVHEQRDGTEEAVFVLAGNGVLTDSTGTYRLHRGYLALLPAAAPAAIEAGAAGIELVVIHVLPRRTSEVLPARRPELRR